MKKLSSKYGKSIIIKQKDINVKGEYLNTYPSIKWLIKMGKSEKEKKILLSLKMRIEKRHLYAD